MAKGKRRIDKIIVHHSASPVHTTVDQIDQWHKARGWNGIGYHFVVLEDCSVGKGRSLNRQGAHTKGQNKHSIGICVTGNFEDYHLPKPRFDALIECIQSNLDAYGLRWNDVYYHQEFSATACCGRYLIEQLKQHRCGRVC